MTLGSLVRTACLGIPTAVLALSLTGCGGSTGGSSDPTPIPIVNPDPNNPLNGVGLENEAQNLDRIKAGAGKPKAAAK
jgi:hypothetical protein